MFSSGVLASYAETTNTAVDQLLLNLQAAAKAGAHVDMLKMLSSMALQVIGLAAFG